MEEILKRLQQESNNTNIKDYFRNYDKFKDNPEYTNSLPIAAKSLAEKEPYDYFENYDKFKDNQEFTKHLSIAAEFGPGFYFFNYDKFKDNQEFADSLTIAAKSFAENYSRVYFEKYDKFKANPEYTKHLPIATENAAEKNESVFFKGFPIFCDNPYTEELLKKPKVALGDNILEIVQSFNYNHDLPNELRFSYLKRCSANNDFDLITKGVEECYTSTYINIANDLMAKLKSNNQMLTDILSELQFSKMDIFLKSAAEYGKISEVLKFIPKEKLNITIDNLFKDISKADEESLEKASILLHVMLNSKNEPSFLKNLENKLKENYNQEKNQDAKDIFGLIASSYFTNFGDESKNKDVFFLGVSQIKDYEQKPSFVIKYKDLVDNKNVCNQLMLFPSDDNDSKESFENFLNQYKGRKGWNIEEKDNYVLIRNDKGNIAIWANKPEKFEEGVEEIKNLVKEKQGGKKAQFQVFVGRGHSYNADDYLDHVSAENKIVSLGSCGGYSNIQKVLKTSPNAQIIATKQTGSMYVNDPLLFAINQEISADKDVNWKNIQTEKLDKIPSDNKNAYVLPHKNIDAQLINAYNKIREKNSELKPIEPKIPSFPIYNQEYLQRNLELITR